MGRSRWLLLVIVPLLVVATAALVLSRQRVPSDAVAVRQAPLVRTLQFSARIATLSRVDVGSTLTGRVAEVLAREGDTVRAGQPLVRLEAQEIQAALAQAVAGERQAQARLNGLRTTGRTAARAQLEQAEATLRAAEAELGRVQQLVAQGFVSGSRADEARRTVDVARAQRDAAAAQAGANADRGTDSEQAQAQLQSARAATAAARARLTQATIVAPAAAKVLSRQVEPGQIVQPGRALLGLALAGPTQVVAQVDERFLEQLRVEQAAMIVADAFPQRRMAARVLSIAPAVDAQRGAVEVKLALAGEPPPFLREDMTLSVEVVTATRDRALVMPARALRGESLVLLVQDGRAVERRVRTGLRTLDAVEVVEGLREGEVVLLAPAVTAGARVKATTVEWQPARTARAAAAAAADPMSALSQGMGR